MEQKTPAVILEGVCDPPTGVEHCGRLAPRASTINPSFPSGQPDPLWTLLCGAVVACWVVYQLLTIDWACVLIYGYAAFLFAHIACELTGGSR